MSRPVSAAARVYAAQAIRKRAAGRPVALLGNGCVTLARAMRPTEPLTPGEALRIGLTYGAAGLSAGLARPFRAPHHTASRAALRGAVRFGRDVPGEVALARYGVLLLDEIEEWSRAQLDTITDCDLSDVQVVVTSRDAALDVTALPSRLLASVCVVDVETALARGAIAAMAAEAADVESARAQATRATAERCSKADLVDWIIELDGELDALRRERDGAAQ